MEVRAYNYPPHIISKIFKYPWGKHLVIYEKFMLKIVDKTLNKVLSEEYAYTEEDMAKLRNSFNLIRIGHYENELGFSQYNSDCFEYTISVKNDKNVEEHKILVYLMGFIKI